MDTLSIVLSRGIDALTALISDLERIEERNEKLRFSLLDQRQTLANLSRHQVIRENQKQRLTELLTDIQSLIDHLEGILRRFSLHASIAMSRTQLADSRITRVFNIVATSFLLPTLIASIYCMNFKVMPELYWAPLAIQWPLR